MPVSSALETGIDYSAESHTLGAPEGLRTAYPPIEPYDSGYVRMDAGAAVRVDEAAAEAATPGTGQHFIWFELSGNPDGYPVVFLHGGPGGGIGAGDRQWFDPEHYKILTFSQRGSGKSRPHADLTDNTTWHLIADIERLRTLFNIERWHVFGGSWGSTLSLAYAQLHPAHVSALILRGIFTLRRSELQFFYGSDGGASHLFPEQHERYVSFIPEEERGDMIRAYYSRLTGPDEEIRLEAADRWSTWENATCRLYVDADSIARGDDPQWALAFARIESHYFVNHGFFPDGSLLTPDNIDKIRNIPTTIVQGRYDIVCPCTTAYALHKVWPEARFIIVPDAGHSAKEPGITHHLIEATDAYRTVQ
ncbi:prolyl aminopeptidase [Malassezia cuniculi]|uniref:Proline iminopeptidase n=1 Tax=Malassezia cuniculi TaxID=948313 RepID=A0AAF0ESJ2_9BASI|nr:prolyl aminopeptidase [Malassezia cuniculi]